MQMQNFEKHVWAEIDLDALRANFRTVKQRAGSLPLCAVVKADSYGHGAVQCARVFAQEGASWLAVSCLAEALQLRRSSEPPVWQVRLYPMHRLGPQCQIRLRIWRRNKDPHLGPCPEQGVHEKGQ